MATQFGTPGKADLSTEMRRCIDACLECWKSCRTTETYCLKRGGKHSEPGHIGMLRDCAYICAVTADFMLRGSPQHHQIARACAEICHACAEGCGRFADDSTMRACAESCTSCARECERMATATV